MLNFSLGVRVEYANSPFFIHNRIVSLDDLLGLARLQGHLRLQRQAMDGLHNTSGETQSDGCPAVVPGVIGVIASNKQRVVGRASRTKARRINLSRYMRPAVKEWTPDASQ